MTWRNRVSLILTGVSLVLLIPGLVEPLITITATMDLFGASRELFRDTRSILQAVRTLHQSGNDFVAGLILLFSVMVPFIKALLGGLILGPWPLRQRYRLYLFVRAISKWSMADVFVVGVFIALLAAKATDNLDAVLGSGFYYFASYCLVSNLAFQVLKVGKDGVPGETIPAPDPRDPATPSS